MTLYEILTSWTGESYVRAYAWAYNEAEARDLFEAKHKGTKYADSFVQAVPMATEGDAPFCTTANDYGYGWDDAT